MPEIRFTNSKHFAVISHVPFKEFSNFDEAVDSRTIHMRRLKFDVRNFLQNGIFELSQWVEYEFRKKRIVFLGYDMHVDEDGMLFVTIDAF
jgi:hypothetical protein